MIQTFFIVGTCFCAAKVQKQLLKRTVSNDLCTFATLKNKNKKYGRFKPTNVQ